MITSEVDPELDTREQSLQRMWKLIKSIEKISNKIQLQILIGNLEWKDEHNSYSYDIYTIRPNEHSHVAKLILIYYMSI